MAAINRQGQRTDLTSRQVVGKLESAEVVGRDAGESGRQVQRYIRLTELAPPILEMVDDKRIAFNPAVELSYLAEKEQQALFDTMQAEDCTPSLAQAQRMKKMSQEGRLNTDVIYTILTEEKPNQKEKMSIQRERIDRFFPRDFSEKQKEDLIVQLLEGWYKKRQREHER
ncbi:hypothetical protein [Paenibacillus validus]|uniref:hypothetical protein n=1 Tax=Paenibacillus validus TaxID=44253 RepID=UPI003D29EC89